MTALWCNVLFVTRTPESGAIAVAPARETDDGPTYVGLFVTFGMARLQLAISSDLARDLITQLDKAATETDKINASQEENRSNGSQA